MYLLTIQMVCISALMAYKLVKPGKCGFGWMRVKFQLSRGCVGERYMQLKPSEVGGARSSLTKPYWSQAAGYLPNCQPADAYAWHVALKCTCRAPGLLTFAASSLVTACSILSVHPLSPEFTFHPTIPTTSRISLLFWWLARPHLDLFCSQTLGIEILILSRPCSNLLCGHESLNPFSHFSL